MVYFVSETRLCRMNIGGQWLSLSIPSLETVIRKGSKGSPSLRLNALGKDSVKSESLIVCTFR